MIVVLISASHTVDLELTQAENYASGFESSVATWQQRVTEYRQDYASKVLHIRLLVQLNIVPAPGDLPTYLSHKARKRWF